MGERYTWKRMAAGGGDAAAALEQQQHQQQQHWAMIQQLRQLTSSSNQTALITPLGGGMEQQQQQQQQSDSAASKRAAFSTAQWQLLTQEIQLLPNTKPTHDLPLARIKKIMKSDEDVKMIKPEVLELFEKACELFIRELTAMTWRRVEALGRRIIQRSDIEATICEDSMYDFLIDIVPRPEPPATTLLHQDPPHGVSVASPSLSASTPAAAAPVANLSAANALISALANLPVQNQQHILMALMPQLMQPVVAASSLSSATRPPPTATASIGANPALIPQLLPQQQAQSLTASTTAAPRPQDLALLNSLLTQQQQQQLFVQQAKQMAALQQQQSRGVTPSAAAAIPPSSASATQPAATSSSNAGRSGHAAQRVGAQTAAGIVLPAPQSAQDAASHSHLQDQRRDDLSQQLNTTSSHMEFEMSQYPLHYMDTDHDFNDSGFGQ